jgi:hypothetical protein
LNANVIASAHPARATVRSVIKAVADDVAENGPVVAPGRQGPAVVVVVEDDELDADDDGPAVVEELFFADPAPHAVSTTNSATMMESVRTRRNQNPFPSRRQLAADGGHLNRPKYHRTSGAHRGGMP